MDSSNRNKCIHKNCYRYSNSLGEVPNSAFIYMKSNSLQAPSITLIQCAITSVQF